MVDTEIKHKCEEIGDGHRAAHCAGETPFKDGGYYLVGNSDEVTTEEV